MANPEHNKHVDQFRKTIGNPFVKDPFSGGINMDPKHVTFDGQEYKATKLGIHIGPARKKFFTVYKPTGENTKSSSGVK